MSGALLERYNTEHTGCAWHTAWHTARPGLAYTTGWCQWALASHAVPTVPFHAPCLQAAGATGHVCKGVWQANKQLQQRCALLGSEGRQNGTCKVASLPNDHTMLAALCPYCVVHLLHCSFLVVWINKGCLELSTLLLQTGCEASCCKVTHVMRGHCTAAQILLSTDCMHASLFYSAPTLPCHCCSCGPGRSLAATVDAAAAAATCPATR